MTPLPVTFFKAVEFWLPIREQRGSTQRLSPPRVRERQSAHLAFGTRRVLSAAGSLHSRRMATRPRAYGNSINRS